MPAPQWRISAAPVLIFMKIKKLQMQGPHIEGHSKDDIEIIYLWRKNAMSIRKYVDALRQK